MDFLNFFLLSLSKTTNAYLLTYSKVFLSIFKVVRQYDMMEIYN